MSVPFRYVPLAAIPVTSIADIIRSKKQGNTITVSGTVKWQGEPKTPNNTKRQVRDANLKTAALKPHLCCPEIQNVVIDIHAIRNTKGCKTRITANTESKNMVRCTSCNRAMLVKNAYLEINTSFQLEKDEKQYNVMANQNTISSYLNEDIFQYKDNVDGITEKTAVA